VNLAAAAAMTSACYIGQLMAFDTCQTAARSELSGGYNYGSATFDRATTIRRPSYGRRPTCVRAAALRPK